MAGMPPWMVKKNKQKKKSEQGDADQDEKRAKDKTPDGDGDEKIEDKGGKKPMFGKKPDAPKKSGPSIGKKFKFKTVIHSSEDSASGDGTSAGGRVKSMLATITGETHASVTQFIDTFAQLVDANFPTDQDKNSICDLIDNRWLSSNIFKK